MRTSRRQLDSALNEASYRRFIPYGALVLIVSAIVTVNISESHARPDQVSAAESSMSTAPTTTITYGQTMLSVPSARPHITGPALLPVEERGLPG